MLLLIGAKNVRKIAYLLPAVAEYHALLAVPFDPKLLNPSYSVIVHVTIADQ